MIHDHTVDTVSEEKKKRNYGANKSGKKKRRLSLEKRTVQNDRSTFLKRRKGSRDC